MKIGDEAVERALPAVKQAKRRLWAGLMAVKPKLDDPYPDDARWTPWTRFVGPRLDDLWAALDTLLAAPAVPQPVDREALRPRICAVLLEHEVGERLTMVGAVKLRNEIADAVLALLGGSVLAGEQEQVEP